MALGCKVHDGLREVDDRNGLLIDPLPQKLAAEVIGTTSYEDEGMLFLSFYDPS